MHNLPELMSEACFEPSRPEDFSWDRLIMVRNRQVLPASDESFPMAFDWTTGFHLVVLGADGHPKYYCKVGAAQDTYLERENEILSILSRDPDLTHIIPRMGWTRSSEVIVQLSAFLEREAFRLGNPRLSLASWTGAVSEILKIHERVSRSAVIRLGEYCGRQEEVVLVEEAAWALNYLASLGLPTDLQELLRSVLHTAGRLPRIPQHGDLWSSNVIRSGGYWWLIDFATYGTVQVPLYDVLHFLRDSASERLRVTRRDSEEPWLRRMRRSSPVSSAVRQFLRESAALYRLKASQVSGAIVFYVVDFAARIQHRNRGGLDLLHRDVRGPMLERAERVWEPHVRELEALAAALRDGEDIGDIVNAA